MLIAHNRRRRYANNASGSPRLPYTRAFAAECRHTRYHTTQATQYSKLLSPAKTQFGETTERNRPTTAY